MNIISTSLLLQRMTKKHDPVLTYEQFSAFPIPYYYLTHCKTGWFLCIRIWKQRLGLYIAELSLYMQIYANMMLNEGVTGMLPVGQERWTLSQFPQKVELLITGILIGCQMPLHQGIYLEIWRDWHFLVLIFASIWFWSIWYGV